MTSDVVEVTQDDHDHATVLVEHHIEEWGWGPLTEIEGLAEFNLAVAAAATAIADTRHRLAHTPAPAGDVGGLVERLRTAAKDRALMERSTPGAYPRPPRQHIEWEAADAIQSQATELATLKQQLAEREEALREAVDILGDSRNCFRVGEQTKWVDDRIGAFLLAQARALTRTDGGDR